MCLLQTGKERQGCVRPHAVSLKIIQVSAVKSISPDIMLAAAEAPPPASEDEGPVPPITTCIASKGAPLAPVYALLALLEEESAPAADVAAPSAEAEDAALGGAAAAPSSDSKLSPVSDRTA